MSAISNNKKCVKMKSFKKRQKRTASFNYNDKKTLIALVKSYPAIWDQSDLNHTNKYAVENAWRVISSKLEKEKNECKVAWTAMREGYRYHSRVKMQKNGFGDPLGEDKLDESCGWKFENDLSFLPSVNQKKSSSKMRSSSSSYSESDEMAKDEESNSDVSTANNVLLGFKSLLEIQNQLANENSICSPFKEALQSFDWMLKLLPREQADTACIEISSMLLERIKDCNDN